jgi:hypothetical protein
MLAASLWGFSTARKVYVRTTCETYTDFVHPTFRHRSQDERHRTHGARLLQGHHVGSHRPRNLYVTFGYEVGEMPQRSRLALSVYIIRLTVLAESVWQETY